MATKAEQAVAPAGRMVRAYRIADVPADAAPAAWRPTALTSGRASPALEMRIGAGEKQAVEKPMQDATQAFEPEPGMVLVQAGTFIMGDDDGSRDEKPQRTVLLNSYWMDTYPVTNADYKAFVDATGHRRPPHWPDGVYAYHTLNHPVTNVSWHDAAAYAAWAGKRLPTEAEWEKAARGTMGQTFAWGDAYRKDKVNSGNEYGGTTPVDQFEEGCSPYGVVDICGNVLEWCADWYYDEYYRTAPRDNPGGPPGGDYRIVRGGFYGDNKAGVRCAARHWAPPSNMQDHIGFRCAKTPVARGQKPAETRPQPAPEAQPAEPKPEMKAPIAAETPLERMAADWPENVAKAIRTMLAQPDGSAAAQKVAVLMVGLGSDLSALVTKYLSDLEIETVARAIVGMADVTVRQRDEVFDEVKSRLIAGDYVLQGGVDSARSALKNAIGPRKALKILDRATHFPSSGFSLLRDIDPSRIISFISKEHPQTVALILSQLDATQAAGVINGLPEAMQADVAYRIAVMENISPQVLRELEESLARDLQAILFGDIQELGGPKAVAGILNRTGRTTEKHILEGLDKLDPELGEEVRNQMFVFDDIANLTDKEIEKLLREWDTKDVAIALKGASEKVQDRVFKNMSEEVGQMIKEEMEFSGPVRMSDVEDVQLRLVKTVRQLEEAGEITVVRGDSRDMFV